MRKIIAGLDIGTNSIKLVVGEFIKNNFHCLSVREVASHGIKKGLIINQEELIPSLKEVFHATEEMLSIPVHEVVLSIPAYNIEAFMSEGVSSITNENRVVTHQDLIRTIHAASYQKVEANRELITVIPTRYKLDNEYIKNPINAIGDKLEMKSVVVTAFKEVVDSYRKVLEAIGVKDIGIVISSLGDYETYKNKKLDNELGAIINIGDEITTVSIFNKGVLMRSEIIELGGRNIDNDIAYIYKITKQDARKLKEDLGLAVSDMTNSEDKTNITDRLGDEIVINQKDLSEIIESRLVEILELVKKQINYLLKRKYSMF